MGIETLKIVVKHRKIHKLTSTDWSETIKNIVSASI